MRTALLIGVLALVGGCALDVPPAALDDEAIIDGRDDDREDHPAVVALTRDTSGETVVCSGTLIAPHAVLTAAHCAPGRPQYVFVNSTDVVGTTRPGSDRLGGYTRIRTLIQHPRARYPRDGNGDMPGAFENDLAVAILEEPIPNVTPLALARTPVVPREDVTLVGFGCTELPRTFGGRAFCGGSGTRRVVSSSADTAVASGTPAGYFAAFGASRGDSGGPTLRGQTVLGVSSYLHRLGTYVQAVEGDWGDWIMRVAAENAPPCSTPPAGQGCLGALGTRVCVGQLAYAPGSDPACDGATGEACACVCTRAGFAHCGPPASISADDGPPSDSAGTQRGGCSAAEPGASAPMSRW